MQYAFIYSFFFFFLPMANSLLSTNRDSTYRDDDPKALDDFNSNGIPKLHKIEKSSSCSSFLFDVLFRGMVEFHSKSSV